MEVKLSDATDAELVMLSRKYSGLGHGSLADKFSASQELKDSDVEAFRDSFEKAGYKSFQVSERVESFNSDLMDQVVRTMTASVDMSEKVAEVVAVKKERKPRIVKAVPEMLNTSKQVRNMKPVTPPEFLEKDE